MSDLPTGRTVENLLLAWLVGITQLRWVKELLGCSWGSSQTYTGKSSSMGCWLFWALVIAGSVPVQWILRLIILGIMGVIYIDHLATKIENQCRDDIIDLCMYFSCGIKNSCIWPMLYCTSWPNPSRDHIFTCFPAGQSVVDGCRSEGNQCQVDFIDQWSIFLCNSSAKCKCIPKQRWILPDTPGELTSTSQSI